MTDQHPITPPDKLVEQWHTEWFRLKVKHVGVSEYVAAKASCWGADQELEACCAWTAIVGGAEALRNHRRPKPPRLAEEALVACERSAFGIPGDRDTIRRALERLKELEKGNG